MCCFQRTDGVHHCKPAWVMCMHVMLAENIWQHSLHFLIKMSFRWAWRCLMAKSTNWFVLPSSDVSVLHPAEGLRLEKKWECNSEQRRRCSWHAALSNIINSPLPLASVIGLLVYFSAHTGPPFLILFPWPGCSQKAQCMDSWAVFFRFNKVVKSLLLKKLEPVFTLEDLH